MSIHSPATKLYEASNSPYIPRENCWEVMGNLAQPLTSEPFDQFKCGNWRLREDSAKLHFFLQELNSHGLTSLPQLFLEQA